MISRWHLRPYIRLVALCSVAVLAFTSCFSRPGGHAGYQKSAYNCRGQHYQPLSVEEALDFQETGGCSWYNESSWFGLKRGTTSLGEKVMPWHLTGAHKTLPLPCLVKVTNLDNGKTLKVRINDRGPFIPGRILDVTPRAAKKLGFYDQGITHAKIEVISIGDGSCRRKKRGWFF